MCKVARRPPFGRAWNSLSCMLAAVVLHVSPPEPLPSFLPPWDQARLGDHNSPLNAVGKPCHSR